MTLPDGLRTLGSQPAGLRCLLVKLILRRHEKFLQDWTATNRGTSRSTNADRTEVAVLYRAPAAVRLKKPQVRLCYRASDRLTWPSIQAMRRVTHFLSQRTSSRKDLPT